LMLLQYVLLFAVFVVSFLSLFNQTNVYLPCYVVTL